MTFIFWIVVSLALAAQNPPAASPRFDYLVRADFFAGAAGDEARLNKALELCERTIEQNPAHPQYIVTEPGLGYRLLPGPSPDTDDVLADRAT